MSAAKETKIWISVLVVCALQLILPAPRPHHLTTPTPATNNDKSAPTLQLDAVDSKLLYTPQRFPASEMNKADLIVSNRLHRIQRNPNPDVSIWTLMDHIERETNHLLNETSPSSQELPTLVTGAWAITPQDTAATSAWITSFLSHKLPRVIFTDEATYAVVRHTAAAMADNTVVFVLLSMSDLEAGLGATGLRELNQVRANPAWRDLASWVPSSPLARSLGHAVVELSRPYVLRHAARLNPFHTRTFLWVDRTDECFKPDASGIPVVLGSGDVAVWNKLTDKMLAPFLSRSFPASTTEVLGIREPSFSHYANIKPSGAPTKVAVLRSSFWGGKIGHIEIVTALYDLTLRTSLKEGLLGTLEAYLTILATRFPNLFHLVNDETACAHSTKPDMSCEDGLPTAGKCALLSLRRSRQ